MKKLSFLLVAFVVPFLSSAQGSGDLENKFYIRVGYSNPTNSYFGIDEDGIWDDIDKIGASLELGQIFILNSIDLSDGLRLGVNVDYAEFTYHQLKSTMDEGMMRIAQVSSKLGPSLSYSPVDNLVFDAFIKVKIPWAAGISDDDIYLGYLGVGFSTGLNVRYRVFMLGFEFNSVNVKLENQDYEGAYFGNAKNDDDNTPLPSVNFTFGFCF